MATSEETSRAMFVDIVRRCHSMVTDNFRTSRTLESSANTAHSMHPNGDPRDMSQGDCGLPSLVSTERTTLPQLPEGGLRDTVSKLDGKPGRTKFQKITGLEEHEPGESSKRRRKFRADERAKIGLVRRVGACMRCRILKMACEGRNTCDSCLRKSQSPQGIDRLPCLRTHLKDFLPYLFAGATTGVLSTRPGDTAFQQELSPSGQRFLYKVHLQPSDHLLDLASQGFDSQNSVIELENMRKILRILDTIYFHQRTATPLPELTSAILSMCIILLSTRAYLESFIRHQAAIPSSTIFSNPPKPEAAIMSMSTALEALFMVAATAMSDDECFDIIIRCAEDAFEFRNSKQSTSRLSILTRY